MFFDAILLTYQHNGNFGKAWIAATRGIRFISTQDIISLNVVRLCDDLYKFIVNSSGDPKKRFSLRMSAILLHGTIRIHNKQVVILQVEAVKVLQRCSIPEGSRISLYEEEEGRSEEHSPHITVRAKRQKRKKKQTEPLLTPLEELAPGMQRFDESPVVVPATDDVFRHPAHPEAITMRETEITTKTRPPEEGFGANVSVEDILDLLERVESTQKPLHRSPQPSGKSAKGSSSESPLAVQPVEIVVQAQVHARRGSFLEVSGTEPVRAELTGKEPTEQYPPIHEPLGITPMEVEHTTVQPPISMEVEIPPDVEKEMGPPVDVPAVPEEAVEAVEPAPRQAAPRRAAPTRKHKILEERENNQFIGPEFRYRLVPLDEPNVKRLYELLWDDEMGRVEALDQVRAADEASRYERSRTNLNIFRCKRVGEDQMRVSAHLPEIESARSTMDQRSSDERLSVPKEASLEEQRRSRRTDIRTPIRVPSVRVEPLPIEETSVGQTGEVQLTTAIDLPVEKAIEQIPMEVEQIPVDIPLEHVIPSAVPEERTPEIEAEELEIVREAQKTRQQDIVDIVSRWDFSSKLLRIEDICEKPFTKLTMARAFSDLLTLCKKSFVRLLTRENSLEFSHILKGPQLEKAK
nr:unnamed protein product [Callosobruchus chinensis]